MVSARVVRLQKPLRFEALTKVVFELRDSPSFICNLRPLLPNAFPL